MGPRPGELEVNSNRRATVGLCTVGHSGVSLGMLNVHRNVLLMRSADRATSRWKPTETAAPVSNEAHIPEACESLELGCLLAG